MQFVRINKDGSMNDLHHKLTVKNTIGAYRDTILAITKIDLDNPNMTDFEKEGDELEWNHKSELGQARIKAKRLKELIKKPLEPQINKDG